METVTAAAVATLVMKYVIPAVKSLGDKVWDKVEGEAIDAAAGFGCRLLQRLVPHRSESWPQPGHIALREEDVVDRIVALACRPDDVRAATLAEGAVESLLAADPGLLAAVGELLASAPMTAVLQGDRSTFVGGDNSGVIVTGDRNTIQR